MKTLSLLLFFFSFSYSEYLLTLEQDNNRGTLIYCINDYSYTQNKINFTDINNIDYSLDTVDYQNINVELGYENDNGACFFDRSKYLGLKYEEYHYLIAVYGIFLSSLISFGFIKAS